MRKIIVLFFMVTSLMFALDRASLIEMVRDNPALLDTTQGQILLQKYHLTKDEVLRLVRNNKTLQTKENNTTIQNNVEFEKKEKKEFNEDNKTAVEIEKIKEKVKTKIDYELKKAIEDELTKKILEQKEEKQKELERQKPLIHPFAYKDSDELIEDLRQKQVLRKKKELQRFSKDFFKNKNQTAINAMPTPEWYKISVGDMINVTLIGVRDQTYSLEVKGDGTVLIPAYGKVKVANLTFKEATKKLKTIFAKNYPNQKPLIEIGEYSTIQVLISGAVEAPGVYNLPSLSFLKDALIACNGIKDSGSVREVIIKRGGKIVKKVDLYQLLIYGISSGENSLHSGDVIIVPVAKNLVEFYGEVKKEAIYELKDGETLADLLKFSGGLSPKANKEFISIKRYENNHIKSLTISLKDAKNSVLKDMDSIYVYPVYEKNVKGVFVYGNVLNPGFWDLDENIKTVGAFFNAYAKRNGGMENILLPDTYFEYGLIRRYNKDLSYKIIQFNLTKELNNQTSTPLMDKDELYIFDSRILKGSPFVQISGEPVLNSGKYTYYNGMSVEDLIAAAGVVSGGRIDMTKIKVANKSVNLLKTPFYKLKPFDDVIVYDLNITKPKKYAQIYGEVNNPGAYEVDEKTTTLKDLIGMAGGLTPKAATNKVEIIRYFIKNNEREKEVIVKNSLEEAYEEIIKADDEVRIFKIPNWDKRQTVTILGEVKYPGVYVLNKGERLYDVIKRAGGFSKNAFVEGAVFTRESLKLRQQKELKESLFRLKQSVTSKSLSATQFGGESQQMTQVAALINSLQDQAEEYQPQGRIAINIDKNLDENSPSNIVLEDKDMLYVPISQDTVTVLGEVLSSATIVYKPGLGIEEYIDQAGGLKESANEDAIFIIHANGMTEKAYNGWFGGMSDIKKGDTIYVPPTVETFSNIIAAKDITSIVYQLAITAASLKTVGALK